MLLAVDPGPGELVYLALQVRDDPAENRVGGCTDFLHDCDTKLARGRVVDQGKGSRVEEIEAEHATVELLGGIQVADSDEPNLLRMTKHLIGPFPIHESRRSAAVTRLHQGIERQRSARAAATHYGTPDWQRSESCGPSLCGRTDR